MNKTNDNDRICALYCGMAYDIMAPLTLIKDVDIIYAICKLDRAFSSDGTWEGVKSLVLSFLVKGNKRYKFEKSRIVSESEEKLSNDTTIWRVEFIYKEKHRTLIYYNGWNFYHDWPVEIQRIQHVLSIGATFSLEEPILAKMLSIRTTNIFRYYRCYYGKNDNAGTVVKTQSGPITFFDIDKDDVDGQAGAWFE